jgi:hypothetical protein
MRRGQSWQVQLSMHRAQWLPAHLQPPLGLAWLCPWRCDGSQGLYSGGRPRLPSAARATHAGGSRQGCAPAQAQISAAAAKSMYAAVSFRFRLLHSCLLVCVAGCDSVCGLFSQCSGLATPATTPPPHHPPPPPPVVGPAAGLPVAARLWGATRVVQSLSAPLHAPPHGEERAGACSRWEAGVPAAPCDGLFGQNQVWSLQATRPRKVATPAAARRNCAVGSRQGCAL